MKYVVRYAHLNQRPALKPRQTLHSGDLVGVMGGSPNHDGKPYYSPHLHIDTREAVSDHGIQPNKIWRLSMTERMQTINLHSRHQLQRFINNWLFDSTYRITTPYLDPMYKKKYGVPHPAYDIIPINPIKTKIYWNLSTSGVVLAVGYDCPRLKGGYGHYCIIAFTDDNS